MKINTSLIRGSHLCFSLFFILLGSAVLILNLSTFREQNNLDIDASQWPARSDTESTTHELESMFALPVDYSAAEFEIVARKNLFSPERRAWSPPESKTDPEEQTQAPALRVDKKDFRLYGITVIQDQKMALLYYKRFPENSRHRLLTEGETFYEDRSGTSLAITVAGIEKESITIEAGEDIFKVDLFSHALGEQSAPVQDEISVFIGGRPAAQESPQQQAPVPPREDPDHEHSSGPKPELNAEEEVVENINE